MPAKIFSFCNQKGGVGKTTSAVNLAALSAKSGSRVLLVDLDSQGNATSGLGIDKAALEFTAYQLLVDNVSADKMVVPTETPNLFVLPANTDLAAADLELVSFQEREFVLKKKLDELRGSYDFIIIDCPPSLGLISINALTSSDYIVIPLQCEYYALEGLGQLLNTYQLVQKNLNSALEVGGVILTMADFRTNLTQQVIEEVKNYFKEKVFETIIPRAVKLSEAPSFGKPAVFYDPYNRGSKAYVDLAKEFLVRFSEKAGAVASPAQNEATPETQSTGEKI
jgi:chromosome partitioning protein